MWIMVEKFCISAGDLNFGTCKDRTNKGQVQIQQMAFMIAAVFFFFILVGLFFLAIQFKDVKSGASQLQKEQAISSLKVIADMPELNYDSSESMTIDEDKLEIMSGHFGSNYDLFWPVASIEVYKVYPAFSEVKECPGNGKKGFWQGTGQIS